MRLQLNFADTDIKNEADFDENISKTTERNDIETNDTLNTRIEGDSPKFTQQIDYRHYIVSCIMEHCAAIARESEGKKSLKQHNELTDQDFNTIKVIECKLSPLNLSLDMYDMTPARKTMDEEKLTAIDDEVTDKNHSVDEVN